MPSTELLIAIFTILVAIIGFFLQRILNRTDEIKDIHRDISEMKPKVDIMWEDIKDLMRGQVKLSEQVGSHERKLDIVADKLGIKWKDEVSFSNSPRIMNAKGRELFKKFEIQKLIDARFDKLVDEIREFAPSSPYDLEEDARRVMEELKADPKLKRYLEHKAYETGEDMDKALYVGSLYLRDKALPLFDFPEAPDLEEVLESNGVAHISELEPSGVDLDNDVDVNDADDDEPTDVIPLPGASYN